MHTSFYQNRNENVSHKLHIHNTTDRILDYEIIWWEKDGRGKENHIPKRFLNYLPQGKRAIERPIKRWIKQRKFNEDMTGHLV